MNTSSNPFVHLWKSWSIPRSIEPTTRYRERALRRLLPIISLLRVLGALQAYSGAPDQPKPYAPLGLYLAFFIVPILFSFYFLARQKVNLAGVFFLLHWYLIDLLTLPVEGHWSSGFQISLIIQVVLATFFLPSRTVLPFMVFQLLTVGLWGNWLDINYYDPPLLSAGQPIANFQRTIIVLAAQESLILLLVRYLRLEMEKALRLQQVTIKQLQTEMTEHQQAELARHQLEDIYRRAIDAAGAVPYVINHADRWAFTFIGTGIHPLTGYSASEMTAEIWDSLRLQAFPRGRLAHLTFDEADRLTNADPSIPWECDFQIRARDGQLRWIADTSVKVFDEQSENLVSIGIYQDITERKQAELALQQLEDTYRRAIDAAGAVPYVLRHEDRWFFTFVGDGILPMTGYSASEMTSAVWNSLLLEAFPRGQLAHLTYEEADRLTNEDYSILWECDFRIRTRDGQIRWIADTSVKGFDQQGEHLISIGIKQDITERKLAEEQLKQLNLELEQRVRARTADLEAANQELEAFSFSVSHDLRAPLRAINSFAKIMEADFAPEFSPAARDFLGKIMVAGGQMAQLIEGLLDFSRTGRKALNLQLVDLEALIRAAIDSLATETASRQIEWVLAKLFPVTADPVLLRQVYANLIGNAVKYTGKRALARIEIGCLSQSGETIYFVRDNGAGFDMQYAGKLFGVFQRLHRDAEFEGTGIGLATVRRIIERHGGRIWAEAEVNRGATFYFTLGKG